MLDSTFSNEPAGGEGFEKIFSVRRGVEIRGRVSIVAAGCCRAGWPGFEGEGGFRKALMRLVMSVMLLRQAIDIRVQAAPEGLSISVNMVFLLSALLEVMRDSSQKANV